MMNVPLMDTWDCEVIHGLEQGKEERGLLPPFGQGLPKRKVCCDKFPPWKCCDDCPEKI